MWSIYTGWGKSHRRTTGASWRDSVAGTTQLLTLHYIILNILSSASSQHNLQHCMFLQARCLGRYHTVVSFVLYSYHYEYCLQWDQRLEGWPNMPDCLAGWRRVTQQGVILILYMMDGPCCLHALKVPKCEIFVRFSWFLLHKAFLGWWLWG